MSLGIFRIIGLIVFMYLLWRMLRGEYEDQKIINYTWVALLGFLVGGRIVYGLINWGVWNDSWTDWLSVWSKPGTNYLGSFIGLVLASWLMAVYNQWRFLSLMDDIIKPSLIYFSLVMVDEAVRTNFYIKPLLLWGILILDIFFVGWLRKRYRSFMWYKSGKKGFVLLFNNIWLFFAIAITLVIIKDSLVSIVLASVISLISVIGLYILQKEKI